MTTNTVINENSIAMSCSGDCCYITHKILKLKCPYILQSVLSSLTHIFRASATRMYVGFRLLSLTKDLCQIYWSRHLDLECRIGPSGMVNVIFQVELGRTSWSLVDAFQVELGRNSELLPLQR